MQSNCFTGKELRLRIGNGLTPEHFSTMGASTQHSVSMSNTEVEKNTKDDGGWRSLIAKGAIKSMQVQQTAIFSDAADAQRIEQLIFDQDSSANFEVIVGPHEKYVGTFVVTSFEVSGGTEGFMEYSVTLASSGPITRQAQN